MPASNQNNRKSQDQLWRDLAAAAQKGDKKAYTKLLREIMPYIKNVLTGGLANPDWVEDITQEVLISVHKSLKTYGPDRPFQPWLMAIINFRRTDYLRKYYSSRSDKQSSLDNADFQKKHVTKSPYAGELKDIEAAIATLPAKQQKVFRLVKIEGYSVQEVAKKMKMSESAVKVSAHRAANKLKEELS
jgi:RNA polymerase sigma-70 factor (ECF subfamily)